MNPVIEAFGATTSITVKRHGAGSYSSETGKWVDGSVTDIEMSGVAVIPAKAYDLRNLPEGMEGRGGIWIFTDAALKSVDQVAKTRPDQIVWDGRTWLVQSVDHMIHIPDLAHYQTLAVEEDVA